jgi:hypothetical protein
MKKKRMMTLEITIFMVIIGFSLYGCISVPVPIGDSSKVHDVLAGKSFQGNANFIYKEAFTFNFDGTVTVNSGLGFLASKQTGTYSVSERTATIVLQQTVTMTLDSATEPTQIVGFGRIYKRVVE